MKAKLIFNLPKDNYDYILANSAHEMYTILHDLQQKLKYELKHNDDLSKEKSEFSIFIPHPPKKTPETQNHTVYTSPSTLKPYSQELSYLSSYSFVLLHQ